MAEEGHLGSKLGSGTVEISRVLVRMVSFFGESNEKKVESGTLTSLSGAGRSQQYAMAQTVTHPDGYQSSATWLNFSDPLETGAFNVLM
ncbi:hypothetical protein M8J77_004046 [Diaphorina citri]|nr:hypothetical protein M8J77_004046 [Diaphorina citri]